MRVDRVRSDDSVIYEILTIVRSIDSGLSGRKETRGQGILSPAQEADTSGEIKIYVDGEYIRDVSLDLSPTIKVIGQYAVDTLIYMYEREYFGHGEPPMHSGVIEGHAGGQWWKFNYIRDDPEQPSGITRYVVISTEDENLRFTGSTNIDQRG